MLRLHTNSLVLLVLALGIALLALPEANAGPNTRSYVRGAVGGAAGGALIEEPSSEEGNGILSIVLLVLAFVVVAGGLFYGRRLLSRKE